MNLPKITASQFYAFGRHVVSYAMGAVTVAVALNFVTGDQGTALSTAVTQIVSGVQSIAGGVATIVSVITAIYAARSASPTNQIAAVASNPDVSKVVTTPAVAQSIPSAKVVSQ